MATPSITSFTSLFYFISYTFPTFFHYFLESLSQDITVALLSIRIQFQLHLNMSLPSNNRFYFTCYFISQAFQTFTIIFPQSLPQANTFF